MTQRASPPHDCDTEDATTEDILSWHSRYAGLLSVARLGGRQVAGISGPWSGRYALTWWHAPPAQRRLDLFDSLYEARCEVEAWARRCYGDAAVPSAPVWTPPPETGLLHQLGRLLPGFSRRQSADARRASLERLRQLRSAPEVDFSGLHFAARDESSPSS